MLLIGYFHLKDSKSESCLLGGIPLVFLGGKAYVLVGIVLEVWLILSLFPLTSSREGVPTFSLGGDEDKLGRSLFIDWVGIESSCVVTQVESSGKVTGIWRLIGRLSSVSWFSQLVSQLLLIEDGF